MLKSCSVLLFQNRNICFWENHAKVSSFFHPWKKKHGNINILVKRLLSTIFRGELHLSSTPKELDQWHLHAYASVALGAAQPVQFQTDLVEGSQRVDVTGPWTTAFLLWLATLWFLQSQKTDGKTGKPPFLMGKSTNFRLGHVQ